jgi:hypothetical protein
MSDKNLSIHEITHMIGYYAGRLHANPGYDLAEEHMFLLFTIVQDETGFDGHVPDIPVDDPFSVLTAFFHEVDQSPSCLSKSDLDQAVALLSDKVTNHDPIRASYFIARWLHHHAIPARMLLGVKEDEAGFYICRPGPFAEALRQPLLLLLQAIKVGLNQTVIEQMIAQSPVEQLPQFQQMAEGFLYRNRALASG